MCKKALITGGSRGIGFEIVQGLLKRNFEVTIISRTAENLKNLPIIHHSIDLADSSTPKRLSDLFKDTQFDLLINNAGGGAHSKIQKISAQKLHEALQLNLSNAIFLTHLISKKMIQQKSGQIINMISIHGLGGDPGSSLYSATKFGLRGFTEALFHELKQHHIRVTALYPDLVNTSLLPASTPKRHKMLTPKEVADTVLNIIDLPNTVIIKELSIYSNR